MNPQKVIVDNKTYNIARQIARGGEGIIFSLQEDKNTLFKLYFDKQKRYEMQEKISAMINLKLASKTSLVAFPKSIAKSTSGEFLGFVMPLLQGSQLHEIYSPGPRKTNFPNADYRFLVRTALNISKAFASVHDAGCVIGDINHSSTLISNQAVVTLIDADSFQFSFASKDYLCTVAVPEYTPPELQGSNFSKIKRTPNHDSFGLAVVLFQILFMGRHPYSGTVKSGEMPQLHENIKNFKYVYANSSFSGLQQPPGTPLIINFSKEIAILFEKAFLKDNYFSRPTAMDWINALKNLEASLIECKSNNLHHIPKGAISCPWCEMEQKLSTVLFLPNSLLSPSSNPSISTFNLSIIWGQIEAIKIPNSISPKLQHFNIEVSEEAKRDTSKKTKEFKNIWATWVGVIGFIVLLIQNKTEAAFLYLIFPALAIWGLIKKETTHPVDSSKYLIRYQTAETTWERELENWTKKTGLLEAKNLKSALALTKQNLQNLNIEELNLIQNYKNKRREFQLNTYLGGFDIRRAKIKGVGPAKEANLLSYGIDTAAEVTPAKILIVPGFGPVNSKPLLEWRASLEKRFVFNPNETALDKQEILKIQASVKTKKIILEKKLTDGLRDLKILKQKIDYSSYMEDSFLSSINKDKLQATKDLEFLGITVPNTFRVRNTAPKQSTTTSQTFIKPIYTPIKKISCPRCGGSMSKRKARQGRYSGKDFWGCDKFPRCKGILNI